MTLTLVIRRPSSAAASNLLGKSRDEIEKALSADPQDLETVSRFATQHGLTVGEVSAAKRSVQVEGTPQQLTDIFGPGVPPEIAGVVTAVLGLNQQPIAKPHGSG
jgi:kumamolisin